MEPLEHLRFLHFVLICIEYNLIIMVSNRILQEIIPWAHKDSGQGELGVKF